MTLYDDDNDDDDDIKLACVFLVLVDNQHL